MKKRIIKLTEQDLEKLVKKIIKEEEMDPNAPEGEGDSKLSSGVQKKTDKITDLPVFGQVAKQLKTKDVNEQVEFFMTLLKKFDLKGNFGKMLKRAMTDAGLI